MKLKNKARNYIGILIQVGIIIDLYYGFSKKIINNCGKILRN